MEENILKNFETRKKKLETDSSDYFSKWGSRNPLLTIREEIDNQISAHPKRAGIKIDNFTNDRSTITTFNDGITPMPGRMETMNCIGKTHSDRRGASICGVGQIEGLVAGRKSPNSTGELIFKSVHNGMMSKFTCVANGKTYTIETENSGPFPTDEQDEVQKIYTGMRRITDDEIGKIKVMAAVKIYPYALKNPGFSYIIQDEEITPFGILYEGVKDKSIKRMEMKEYTILYHGKRYTISAGAVDAARYVKPDGFHIDKNKADKLDRIYGMSPESGGVFVEIGDVNVITGGKDSWKFIGRNYHTTHNGQRIWIRLPSEGQLKDAVFAESPNKSSISICLDEITDYDGRKVFDEMLNEIGQTLNLWTTERGKVNKHQKDISSEEEEKVFNKILDNDVFLSSMEKIWHSLREDEISVLESKKFKTILRKSMDKKKNMESK